MFFFISSYYLPSRCEKARGFTPPLDHPLGPHHGPAAKLTLPPDSHLHSRIILQLFLMKNKTQKLNLLLKLDISKTAWINPCLRVKGAF